MKFMRPPKKEINVKDTTAVHSCMSDEIIKNTIHSDDSINGFIVHGNLRAVTENVHKNYGGLVGNNFTTDQAEDDTNSNAFTAKEFLEICKFPVDVLIGGLVDRLLIQKGGKHQYHSEIESALLTIKNATSN